MDVPVASGDDRLEEARSLQWSHRKDLFSQPEHWAG